MNMKHALTQIAGILGIAIVSVASNALAQTTAPGPYYATPSWDQQLPASTRFIVLSNWGSAAVLDRETGLVWERSPSTTSGDWFAAQTRCINLEVGGRTGWRLPAIQELMSLVDRSVLSPSPVLPSGHPFINVVRANHYWSATTATTNPPLPNPLVYAMAMFSGFVEPFSKVG
jgi:Protein of unknown function (DUF1566)